MKGWLRHHVRSLVGTLGRLAREPISTLLNVVVIGVAGALPLGAYVVLTSVEGLSSNLGGDPQLSVFFAQDANRADVERVESMLKKSDGVARFKFVSKDQALADLRKQESFGEAIGALRSNPLPDAFLVYVGRGDAASAEQLAEQLRAFPRVAHVQIDAAWLRRLEGLLRLARTAMLVFGALLAAALVAVTFNTIRLQVLTQVDEVVLCRLLGATNAYIRRPFYYLGAWLGLLGALFAIALVWAALALVNQEVRFVAALYSSTFELAFPPLRAIAGFVGLIVLLGLVGASLSVSTYLHSKR